MPVLIDLFLWLGPHLGIGQVTRPSMNTLASLLTGSGFKSEDVSNFVKLYQQFNLLGIVRTFPIGVFSLMSGKNPLLSPLGLPVTYQVDSPDHLVEILFLLTLAGWIIGALYFRSVAALVTKELLPNRGRAIVQTFLYSLIWSVLLWGFGIPLLLFIYFFFMLNPYVGEAVLLILGFLSMWLIVPVFFSPLGIFIKKQNALASIIGSFRMTRYTLPAGSLFVLIVIGFGVGLNILWAIPDDNSWVVAVGILGHAFIMTALLASTFAYYRDITAWLQTVLGRLRAAVPVQPG